MALIECPKIQGQLNDAHLRKDFVNPSEKIGLTEFLLSPFNTDGFLQNQLSQGSKIKQVELIYSSAICESAVSDSAEKLCVDPSNEAGQLSQLVTLDPTTGSSYAESFDISEMNKMCQDNELWFATRLQAGIDAVVRKMSTDNATQLQALVGKFNATDNDLNVAKTLKTIATRKTGSTDYTTTGYEEILFSSDLIGKGTPFVFGMGEGYKYFKALNAGCCTSSGLSIPDYLAQNDIIFMADTKVASVFGQNDLVMLKQGAVQLVTYTEFSGKFGMINDEAYKQMIITDPKTGLSFDLQIKNDGCKLWFNIKLSHKLVGLPTDMACVGGDFEGVTYVNEFTIVNA